MRLRRSQHIAFFHRRAVVYCRHGLTGELTAMSSDVRDLVVAFGEGREVDAVLAEGHLHDPAEGPAFVETLQRLAVLVPPGTDELARLRAMVPVVGRWVPWIDDGGVHLVEGRNLETAPRVITLDPFEARVFRAIDGERDVQTLAAALDGRAPHLPPRPGTLRRVQAALATFAAPERQWVALAPARLSYYRRGMPRPPWLDSTMPYPALADGIPPADAFATDDGGVDNRAWHREAIVDADAQFEDRETTLSHLFRHPHPALGGRTFGAALVAALQGRGAWPAAGGDIVEVGGGAGWLAAAAIEAWAATPDGGALGAGRRYRILELSPTLLQAQLARVGPVAAAAGIAFEGLPQDIEAWEPAPASVDLLLANEMAGDLRADAICRAAPELAPTCASPRATALIERYGLDLQGAPDESWLNTGALELLERAALALRPGGALWLSEFGHREAWPVESTHLDHPEVSIHFGLLLQVAQRLGLRAEVVDVVDVLGIDEDLDALQTTATAFRNLRALAATAGAQLDKRAWTAAAFAAALGPGLPIGRLRNLRFGRLGDRVMGLRPREFLALVAHKPAAVMPPAGSPAAPATAARGRPRRPR